MSRDLVIWVLQAERARLHVLVSLARRISASEGEIGGAGINDF